jgi:hypothetical protein
MTVITNSSSSIVDKIVMLSSIGKTFRLQDLAPGVAPSISFSKTSSTHYALQISSEGPVFVLFGETYDASWNARIGNVVLNHQSVPFHMYWSTLYTSANLSQTKVEVNFDQQEQRNAIITIWGVGWLLSLSYVSFASRERIVRLSRKLKSRRKTRA